MLPGEDCDCWIEPDVTYTILDPVTAWDFCEGGAQEGVDCFHQLLLPFDFCFYGTTYDQVWITTKGTISFGNGYYDWTPSEFPTPVGGSEDQHNHVCGFWQDFDFNNSGQYFYKITDDALYINFIDVGYYNSQADKLNTMQMIITADGAEILGDENNVQFCYLDMDWAHGDIGGQGGCTGTTPANVGADKDSGNEHIQFGRFNLCNTAVYNGPYGQGNNQIDGVDWLDNKSFEFNACESSTNIPPIPTSPTPCDTFYVCINDSINISTQFIAPESNQNVTITVVEDGNGLEFAIQNNNTATFLGTFIGTADNVGVHYVTVTATDNGTPQGQVVYEYVILVQDIVMPELFIEAADSVCAGGIVDAEASPGYDTYTWSEPNCSPNQDCQFQVPGGGDAYVYYVTGTISGCQRSTSATVYVDPFDYVDITTSPDTLCPGQCATACVIETGNYIAYDWHVYAGYEGEMCDPGTVNDTCTTMHAGTYEVFATTPANCLEFNIFVIEETNTVVPPENESISMAYCDGIVPVVFAGAYQSPASGLLTVYTVTGDPDGWLGSYLLITVTPCDPLDPVVEYIATTTESITIDYIPIGFCDEITVEYISSGGGGDQFNTVYLFNCSNLNQTIIGPGLEPGLIWSETSGCVSNPYVSGDWTVESGPPGWSFSDDSQYNNTFTPGAYGLYELCFFEPTCSGNYCYDLEFTLAPELSLLGDGNVELCEGQSEEVCPNITDVGGTGDLDWDGQGVVPNFNGTCAVFGPYDDYEDFIANISISNGCGEVSIDIPVNADIAVPPITLPADNSFCGNETITLDPVSSADDDDHLVYDWSTGEDTPTIDITSSGTYTVEVTNDCDNASDAVTYTIVSNAVPLFVPSAYNLECETGEVELCVGVPVGYTIVWSPGGATTNCITASSSGTYSWAITDISNCETLTDSSHVVNITYAPEGGSSNSDLNILCPGECAEFNATATYADSYTWTSDCDQLDLSGGAVLSFCSDQVPTECLYIEIEITGTASNECSPPASVNFVVQNNQCLITIPNVFTPGATDSLNNKFQMTGIELYEGAALVIFNRWGGEVYRSDNYGQNNDFWKAEDVPGGTYYYSLKLPYGTKLDYEGYITVIK